jgi:uncharacterized membrane protein YhaH (DUF805 family)
MSFAAAVSSVFRQYATFTGRARRSEFWWFALFAALVSTALDFLDAAVFPDQTHDIAGGPLGGIFQVAILLPSVAVGARRLHDTDRSGWWQLIGLVPLVGIVALIVFWVQDGHHGENRFGPSVKYPSPGAHGANSLTT